MGASFLEEAQRSEISLPLPLFRPRPVADLFLSIFLVLDRGLPAIRVVAHENVTSRFERYKATAGYNSHINSRQFQVKTSWPTTFRYPDVTYQVRPSSSALSRPLSPPSFSVSLCRM